MRDIFAQKMANDTVSENNPKKSYLNFRAKILVHYSQFTHFHFGAKIQNILFLFLAGKFRSFCLHFWRENSNPTILECFPFCYYFVINVAPPSDLLSKFNISFSQTILQMLELSTYLTYIRWGLKFKERFSARKRVSELSQVYRSVTA